MEKREGLKKKEKPKSNILFDVLKDIKIHKQGTLLDNEINENDSSYNNYIAFRFLSMNENLCPIVNSINHLQDSFNKKDMYKVLIEMIPETLSYDQYIKAKSNKEEYEEDVSTYFECSKKEAREYIDIMGNEWAEKIHKSFGGQHD